MCKGFLTRDYDPITIIKLLVLEAEHYFSDDKKEQLGVTINSFNTRTTREYRRLRIRGEGSNPYPFEC
jgi:hypothetical protein